MIDVRSSIGFSGRDIGSAIGGQGSTQKAVKDTVRYAERAFQWVQSGGFAEEAGKRAAERIKQRTAKGEQPGGGGGFKPYSKQYEAWKKKQGRFRGKPDLWLYGDMLNAVDFNVNAADKLKGDVIVKANMQRSPNGGRNSITTDQLARIHHKGEGKMPARPFFEWKSGSIDDQKLIQTMRAIMARHVRAQARGDMGAPTSPSGRSIITELI